MRVVFDTNVWVSAIRSRRGASFALLSEIPYNRFTFGISVPLYLEYSTKLFNRNAESTLTDNQIKAILSALAHYGVEVPIYYLLRPNLKDENDNMVFECAAHFNAEKIITHNVKDFTNPELKHYGIEITTPGEFIKILRSQE
jgi:putative PIN family toxin of toxin-antitoxin system